MYNILLKLNEAAITYVRTCICSLIAKIGLLLQEGNTPLLVALEKGHTETAQLLIDKRADVNQCNKVYVFLRANYC